LSLLERDRRATVANAGRDDYSVIGSEWEVSGSAEVIFEALDVIFAQITTTLYFNQDKKV